MNVINMVTIKCVAIAQVASKKALFIIMIISFRDKITEALFRTDTCKRIPSDVVARASRQLQKLNAAKTVEDLRFPPSNRLEKLKGHKPERWSIRVNKQYRITFEWPGTGPENVAFEDYH